MPAGTSFSKWRNALDSALHQISKFGGPSTKIGALPVGRHEISVTLNTNDHRFYAVNGERVEASEQININE